MSVGRSGSSPDRPERYLHVLSSDLLTAYRTRLISDAFAGTLPAEVGTLSAVASPVAGLTNLDHCDEITMVAYAARPRVWWPSAGANNQVMLLHQGHSGTYNDYRYNEALQTYLTDGFTVCGCVMPGGANTVTSSSSTDHQSGHPTISDLTGPAIVAINTLVGGHDAIHAQGLSGGGWTVTLLAALDTRVKNSYPTAGSLPLYMAITQPANGFRDWEQLQVSVATQANYLDLYILGSCGSGRRQKQILHRTDDVIFSLADYNTGYPYADLLAAQAAALSGDFDLVFRTKTTHEFDTTIITEEILSEIPT
jgi:hypothetical protein